MSLEVKHDRYSAYILGPVWTISAILLHTIYVAKSNYVTEYQQVLPTALMISYIIMASVSCLACINMIKITSFLARWLTSARAYRICVRKLCPSVCLYVKRYLLLQFCTDYNQTWINMIWAVAAKTLLSHIFHKWRKIEVNCVYISLCTTGIVLQECRHAYQIGVTAQVSAQVSSS